MAARGGVVIDGLYRALPLIEPVYGFNIKAGDVMYQFQWNISSQSIPGNFNRFFFSPYLFPLLPPYYLSFSPRAAKPAAHVKARFLPPPFQIPHIKFLLSSKTETLVCRFYRSVHARHLHHQFRWAFFVEPSQPPMQRVGRYVLFPLLSPLYHIDEVNFQRGGQYQLPEKPVIAQLYKGRRRN